MTFRGELRKLKKEALGFKRMRRKRTERLAIEEFIKKELREEAKKGTGSKDFPTLCERQLTVKGEKISITEKDYICFAIKHLLWFKVIRNKSFLSLNYVRIFF